MPHIIGVDIGLKGGLAYYDGHEVVVNPMPSIKAAPKKGKKASSKAVLDLPDLVNMLDAWHTLSLDCGQGAVCFVEKVGSMPKQGVASTFKFGTVYGVVQGIVAAMRMPMQLVTPQAWKKEVLAGTAKDKEAAVNFVKMRYPTVSLLPTERSRVPSDGMADAVCIAEYGRRVCA